LRVVNATSSFVQKLHSPSSANIIFWAYKTVLFVLAFSG
jgi:hypothetical protein